MLTLGISFYVESAARRCFGTLGVYTARAPRFVLTTVVCALFALCGGLWTMDAEHNVNDLLISRRGRISGEKDFFVDNFEPISPVLNSVIVTPKDGVGIFSVEALDEVYALQEHIRTFAFEYKGHNVSLEQFCFKTINADPTEPCWQSSLLESFREGAVFNVGGELNTNYAVLFAPRPSYRDFDFESGLTRLFIAQTNLNPDSILLGGFEVDPGDGDTITEVAALQIAFGAKSPEVLQQDGLQYFEWREVEQTEDASVAFCPDASQCEACADALQATQIASSGCTFDGAQSQSAACCEFMEVIRASPCIETVFERRAEVPPEANPLFTACGFSTVEISQRCNNQALFLGARSADLPPEVCVCLAGASEECAAAASGFLAENGEYAEAFAAADTEEEDAVAELARVLIEELGCDPPEETTDAGGDAESETAEAAASDATAAAAQTPVQYQAAVTVVDELTRTTHAAKDLMHEWEKAWRDQIGDVVSEYQYIDVVWLTSTSVDDEVMAAAEAEFDIFAAGYVLVFAYIVLFVTFDWKLTGVRLAFYPPGPGTASLCFLLILLSVAAAIGVAGYVSDVSEFKIPFTTIQMMPLFMLGLGVNDFFVICSSLKSVMSSPTCPKDVTGIMYETMSIGGVSITLSSAANTAAYALCALSDVPIVLWFNTQMAAGIVLAYIVSVVAIPSVLSIAVERHLEEKPDFLMALLRLKPCPPQNKSSRETGEQEEGVFASFVRRFRWPIAASILAVLAVWMAFGIKHMIHFEQGADLSESVQEGKHTYHFLRTSEDYFDTTQINVVFKDSVDYASPEDFQAARDAEYEFVIGAHRVEEQLMTVSWMEFYTQYVEGKFCSNEICMNEVEWYYDGFSSAEFAHPTKNICTGVEDPEECENMCETHCPQGRVGSAFRCQYRKDSTECYCPYRPMLKGQSFYENPEGFDSKIRSYWADFLANTTMGRASRILIRLDEETETERNPLGMPQASRSYAYARGLTSVPHQLRHLEDGREILDDQEVDTYAFDFLVYGIGEQYQDLPSKTAKAVAISLAVVTVVMLPLVVSIITAVIVTCCVAVSVLLAVGMSSWTVINLDYGAYVAFIVAAGLSVEFSAHIARAFMIAKGDRLTRVLKALGTMGVAVMNGGITTFLSIFPAAFSDLPPIRDRLFVQFSIIALSGMFVGLFFLPVVLSLVGPPPYEMEKKEKELDKTVEP